MRCNNVFLRNFILFIVLSTMGIIAAGCCNNGFSSKEQQIIRNGGQSSLMRLYTIENPSDSTLLRTKSVTVSDKMLHSSDFQLLKERMLTTVRNPENEGIGIAAPQVGILRRIVAVQRFDMKSEPFQILVNPEILSLSEEKALGSEGCLSVPGRRGDVLRSESLVIRYIDGDTFETREEPVSGFTAVIIQHETDHLDGRLYIDYIE